MRLPVISRKRDVHASSPAKTQETCSKIHDFQPSKNITDFANWTVQINSEIHALNHTARPAGAAEDLSIERVTKLTAEVERLTRELHSMQLRVDEVLDRESMHVNAPHMECLTTAAAMERRGAPRARHLPALDETAAGASMMQVWA